MNQTKEELTKELEAQIDEEAKAMSSMWSISFPAAKYCLTNGFSLGLERAKSIINEVKEKDKIK